MMKGPRKVPKLSAPKPPKMIRVKQFKVPKLGKSGFSKVRVGRSKF